MGKRGSTTEVIIAIIAGLLLIAGGIGIYWTRSYGWSGDLVYAPGILLTSISIFMSFLAIFRRAWPVALIPLVLNILFFAAFWFLPWHNLSIRIDYEQNKEALTDVAMQLQTVQGGAEQYRVVQKAELQPDQFFAKMILPEKAQELTVNSHIYSADTICGRFVYFPAAFKESGGTNGLLYVPECEAPENFPGAPFDVRWWPAQKIVDQWFWVRGS